MSALLTSRRNVHDYEAECRERFRREIGDPDRIERGSKTSYVLGKALSEAAFRAFARREAESVGEIDSLSELIDG